MENKEKYLALLHPNTPENNLLVVQLLQSQLNCSLEDALQWVLKYFIEKFSDPLISIVIGFGKIEMALNSGEMPYIDRVHLPDVEVDDNFEIIIIIRDEKEEVFSHWNLMGMSFKKDLLDIINIEIISVLVKYLA